MVDMAIALALVKSIGCADCSKNYTLNRSVLVFLNCIYLFAKQFIDAVALLT